MQSIYEKDEELSIGGKLSEGKRYPFTVVDATYKTDVVVYNAEYPKGIAGKEKKDLNQDQVAIIDKTPAATWDDGREKPKYEDRLTLSILQPDTNIKMFYGVEFRFPMKRPGKDFYEFIRSTTGKDPEEGKLSLAKTIPKGTQFTAIVIKDKNGYFAIDKKQPILPLGMESEAPASPVTSNDSLSEPAKIILDHMIAKRDTYQAKSAGTVYMMVGKELAPGVITSEQFKAGWRELKAKLNFGDVISL